MSKTTKLKYQNLGPSLTQNMVQTPLVFHYLVPFIYILVHCHHSSHHMLYTHLPIFTYIRFHLILELRRKSYMMDVFIPEDYVRKRRLEKKLAAKVASIKGSQTHSHWNNSNERIKDNVKTMSFTHHQYSLVDDHLFTCLSA